MTLSNLAHPRARVLSDALGRMIKNARVDIRAIIFGAIAGAGCERIDGLGRVSIRLRSVLVECH